MSIGLAHGVRAEELEPRGLRRARRRSPMSSRARVREDQPRARRRPAASRRQARGRHASSSGSTSTTTIALEPSDALVVEGFADDTIVRAALEALALAAGVEPHWRVRIDKRIPVAAGLGGGSSDAAAALRLANADARRAALVRRAAPRSPARVGADVPFFLRRRAAARDRRRDRARPLELPTDYGVLLVVPDRRRRSRQRGLRRVRRARRRGRIRGARGRGLHALEAIASARDLAALPLNDLASSPLAGELERCGRVSRGRLRRRPGGVRAVRERTGRGPRRGHVLLAGRTFVTRPVGRGDLPPVAR